LLITAVYGSNWQSKRVDLWKDPTQIKNQYGLLPWMVAGDFNVERYAEEKIRGRKLNYNQLREFNECLETCVLSDIRSNGGSWSWNNKVAGQRRIAGRLNRVVCNDTWYATLPGAYYHYLDQSTSNQSPMLLNMLETQKSFKYFNYWADCEGFVQLVREVWETPMYGQMQYQVAQKLKKLKEAI